MNTKNVAIIPARGGSKGIPRKNIKKLCGKPLIAYTIEEALNSEYIDKVSVSTDDEEIAEISKFYGAEIIKRPTKYARDDSHRRETIKHAIKTLRNQMNYDPKIITFLQPTSPLRTVIDIDEAIKLFLNSDCDSVVSVYDSREKTYWSFQIKETYIEPLFGWDYFLVKRRQELPASYVLNGAIYITKTVKFIENNSLINKRTLPYIMPAERSLDIDDEIDFKLAKILIGDAS